MTSPETETNDTPQDSEEKQPLNLDVDVASPNSCTRHVTVTVAREDVDRYFDEAFTTLMPEAAVPGFRAGRAPRKLVEQRFRDQVSDQVKSSILMDSMTQISEEHEFSAIGEPEFDFDAIEIPEEGPLKFEFDLEVRPEFDLPDWKGMKLDQLKREFTSEDVDHQLADILSEQADVVPHDGEAAADDYLVLNISVSADGEKIANATEQLVAVKPIASFPDGRLEGFDELMSGVKAGDKKQTKCTISHDAANVDLQGKEVDVEFEVLEVKKLEIPELDADVLARLGAFANEGELRDRVKDELERRMEYQQQQRIRKQITSLLTKTAEWDLPPDLVRRQSNREMERASMEMKSSGFSEAEIRAYEHELRQNSLSSTKTALQEHFILERIAEEEELDADPTDYDSEINLIAFQSRESPRRVRARLEKKGLMDALRNQIIERKVLALIQEHAKFNEVKYEPEKNETVAVEFVLSGGGETSIPEAKHGDSQALQQPVDRS